MRFIPGFRVSISFRRPSGSNGPISGKTPDGKFVEIAELPDHPWFLAVQYHPEFKSKPLAPHPLFSDFVRASLAHREARRGEARVAGDAVTQT